MEQGEWRKAFTSAFNALHETAENSKERARLYIKIGNLFFHFKKKVLSIYNPNTTPKSSKTIYNKVSFINSTKLNNLFIQKKILKFIN